eukprot:augustus_masked-scaffold_2-processed-gene-27.12-mRNA-1 protein AED:1.00 eAED:1.00 QI:0/-1/0/0/-1/1/1/0/834
MKKLQIAGQIIEGESTEDFTFQGIWRWKKDGVGRCCDCAANLVLCGKLGNSGQLYDGDTLLEENLTGEQDIIDLTGEEDEKEVTKAQRSDNLFPEFLSMAGWMENLDFCSRHAQLDLHVARDTLANNVRGTGNTFFGSFRLEGSLSKMRNVKAFALQGTIFIDNPDSFVLPESMQLQSCLFCSYASHLKQVHHSEQSCADKKGHRTTKKRKLSMLSGRRGLGKKLQVGESLCPKPDILAYKFLGHELIELKFGLEIYKPAKPAVIALKIEQLSRFEDGREIRNKECQLVNPEIKLPAPERRFFIESKPADNCDCPPAVCSCCCYSCKTSFGFKGYEMPKPPNEEPNGNRRMILFPQVAVTKCRTCTQKNNDKNKNFISFIKGFKPGRYSLKIISGFSTSFQEHMTRNIMIYPPPQVPRSLSALVYKAQSTINLPNCASEKAENTCKSFEPVLLVSWTTPQYFKTDPAGRKGFPEFDQSGNIRYYSLQLQTRTGSDEFKNFGEVVKYVDHRLLQSRYRPYKERKFNTLMFALPEIESDSALYENFRIKVVASGDFGVSEPAYSPTLPVPKVERSLGGLSRHVNVDFLDCDETNCVICGDDICFESSFDKGILDLGRMNPGKYDSIFTRRSGGTRTKQVNQGLELGGRLFSGKIFVPPELMKLPVSPDCCSHLYHISCLLKWAKTSRKRSDGGRRRGRVKCPLCMQKFQSVQRQTLHQDLQDQRDRFLVDTELIERQIMPTSLSFPAWTAFCSSIGGDGVVDMFLAEQQESTYSLSELAASIPYNDGDMERLNRVRQALRRERGRYATEVDMSDSGGNETDFQTSDESESETESLN